MPQGRRAITNRQSDSLRSARDTGDASGGGEPSGSLTDDMHAALQRH